VSERVAIFDSLMNRIIEADERVPPGYLTSLNYFRFSAANVDEGSGILFFLDFVWMGKHCSTEVGSSEKANASHLVINLIYTLTTPRPP